MQELAMPEFWICKITNKFIVFAQQFDLGNHT